MMAMKRRSGFGSRRQRRWATRAEAPTPAAPLPAPRASTACAAAAALAALGAIALALAVPAHAEADEAPAPAAPAAATPAAATPADRAAAAAHDLAVAVAARADAEARLAAVERAALEPEVRSPDEVAALAALALADERIAGALAAIEGALADPGARAALVRAAQEAPPPVVDALAPLVAGRCGEPGGAALAAIAARADEPSAPLVLALGRAEGARAKALAWSWIDDPRRAASSRRAALLALRLAPADAPRLAALLADEAPEVAAASASRLRGLALTGERDEVIFGTLDGLRALLREGAHDRRLLAVGALAAFPPGLALAELELLLGDPSATVAAAAVATIGRLDDPLAVVVLRREAQNPYRVTAVRRAAIAELGRRRIPDAAGDLVDLVREVELRDHAAHALRAISGEAYGPSHAMWASWLERERAAGRAEPAR